MFVVFTPTHMTGVAYRRYERGINALAAAGIHFDEREISYSEADSRSGIPNLRLPRFVNAEDADAGSWPPGSHGGVRWLLKQLADIEEPEPDEVNVAPKLAVVTPKLAETIAEFRVAGEQQRIDAAKAVEGYKWEDPPSPDIPPIEVIRIAPFTLASWQGAGYFVESGFGLWGPMRVDSKYVTAPGRSALTDPQTRMWSLDNPTMTKLETHRFESALEGDTLVLTIRDRIPTPEPPKPPPPVEYVRIERHRDAGSWPAGPYVYWHQRTYRFEWKPHASQMYWVALATHPYFPLTREQYRRADRDRSKLDGETLVLAQLVEPDLSGSPPPEITDVTLREFTDKVGQKFASVRWSVPEGADIEVVELDRMDPGYWGTNWETAGGGDGLMLWQGDGYKTHQLGPPGRYAFRVRAYNAVGAGPWSKVVEATV